MNKKLARLILLVFMFQFSCSFLPNSLSVSAQENTIEFAGGSGTAQSPYLIATTEHLNNVKNYLNAYFIQINHLDFTSLPAWTPIGVNQTNPFTGNYNGNNKTITGLKVNISKSSENVYTGLFGYNTGTVQNVSMVSSQINGTVTTLYASCCGSVAGWNSGTISGCSVMEGSVISNAPSSSLCGGLVGNNNGVIIDCNYNGIVTANTNSTYCIRYAGGITGSNIGTIKDSYNTGNITASAGTSTKEGYSGGVVGFNNSIVNNCYNTGKVSATNNHGGGIAGYNESGGSLTYCYNTGSVGESNRTRYAGGISGYNDGAIQTCYNKGNVISSDYTSGVNNRYGGGIVGYNNYQGSVIACYNTADVVTGSTTSDYNSYCGGISGYQRGTILNCYNIGWITAISYGTGSRASYSGGIIGHNYNGRTEHCYNVGGVYTSASTCYAGGIVAYNGGFLTKCYFNTQICGPKGYGGGSFTLDAIGLTTAQMKDPSSYESWDYNSVWAAQSDANNGYPFLTALDHNLSLANQESYFDYDGVLHSSVLLKKAQMDNFSAVLMVALYDSHNRLVDFSVRQINNSSLMYIFYECELDTRGLQAGPYQQKAFLWDGVNLQPLCDVLKINYN